MELFQCKKCLKFTTGDDARIVQEKVSHTANKYKPGLVAWCGECRSKNFGKFKLVKFKPA